MKEKKIKYQTEEQKEIKKFIIVLIGLILIIVGIYYFTRAFVTKDLFKSNTLEKQYTNGAINYEVAIVGNMLNKPQTEYYVMALNSENIEYSYYRTIASKYSSKEKALKVYFVDLNNALNEKYVAKEEEKSNKYTSLEELKLGEITLIKVKNGKVSKFITDIDSIKKELH